MELPSHLGLSRTRLLIVYIPIKRKCCYSKYDVVIVLVPVLMNAENKKEFEEHLKEYNATQTYPVMHVNTILKRVIDISNVVYKHGINLRFVSNFTCNLIDFCYFNCIVLHFIALPHRSKEIIELVIKTITKNKLLITTVFECKSLYE